VLLIVIVTNPPPFHVDESANEMPALHDVDDPLEGGVTGVEPELPEEEEVAVELELELAAELELLAVETELETELLAVETELELELELELLAVDTEEPAEQSVVAHSQVAASLHEGEPPPPHGT